LKEVKLKKTTLKVILYHHITRAEAGNWISVQAGSRLVFIIYLGHSCVFMGNEPILSWLLPISVSRDIDLFLGRLPLRLSVFVAFPIPANSLTNLLVAKSPRPPSFPSRGHPSPYQPATPQGIFRRSLTFLKPNRIASKTRRTPCSVVILLLIIFVS
jgi:hypothetical protein